MGNLEKVSVHVKDAMWLSIEIAVPGVPAEDWGIAPDDQKLVVPGVKSYRIDL